MKKFTFKLQVVLDKRQKELEDKQLEMAKVQSRLKEQECELERLINKQKQTKEDLEQTLSNNQNIDLMTIKVHQDYIEKLSDDIQMQHKIIADTELELEAKQQEVIEALKAKKTLEKLKEKHFKEFIEEFEFQQQKELEDLTQARFRLRTGKKVI